MSDKIFGEKDGDPVEVYPVWNDEYLKNIRIDENYLKGIILQPRGKLKGNISSTRFYLMMMLRLKLKKPDRV